MSLEKETAAGSGLFEFSMSGDAPLSDMWMLPGPQHSNKVIPSPSSSHWLVANQPSPAVPRSAIGSKALKRKSGATELIKKSLAALDEVVSSPSLQTHSLHAHTPGSLLKDNYSGMRSTSTSHTGTPDSKTPVVTGAARQQAMETPQASLSIMDESGFTRELLMATPGIREDDIIMDYSRGQTSMSSTLFGHSHRKTEATNVDEDPVNRTSRKLVTSFHECYSNYQSSTDSLELAHQLQDACDKQVQAMEGSSMKSELSHLLSELRLERSVWELICVLYTDRLEVERMDEGGSDVGEGLTGGNDKQIADEFFLKESSVRQSQLVVDWLEKNAVPSLDKYPTKVSYFADSVCWENTLHCLQQKLELENIVSEMDPDAPRRQDRPLADLDEKDEQALVKHLFTCVRAGHITKAQEICVQCGQSWRAATLEGWKLYNDPNSDKNVLNDELDPVEGNFTRDLWKISAWELAKDPSYSHYERAIYAALSGNIKQLLPACNHWLDCVWAYFKVMVDVLTEQRLRGYSSSTEYTLQSLPPEYWNAVLDPELIFQEVEASHSTVIRKEAMNPFHMAHKFIILGNLKGLISEMGNWIMDRPNLYQLRFMAHLVLLAQGLGEAYPEDETCSNILEAYVKELTRERFSSFVALYTARLPYPLQISCYANLLHDVVNPENQRRCLELGSEAGLDIAVITKAVVEHVRTSGNDDVGILSGPELAPQTDTEMTQLDQSKIEVIQWLVFNKEQRAEALAQGNALMRQFLVTRKLSAANALFKRIPSDSVAVVTRNWAIKAGDRPLPEELVNDIHEYCSIQAYLSCHTSFNSWFHHFYHSRPEPPSEPSEVDFQNSVAYEQKLKQYELDKDTWETSLQELTMDAEKNLYNILLFESGGWMVDQAQCEGVDDRREKQLQLLREVCIPQTVLLLHTVLNSTGQTKKSLQLADIVASEEHQLYKVFRQHELERLLSLLYNTASSSLSDSHLDLGYLH